MGRKGSKTADAKGEPLSRKERRQQKEQSKQEGLLQELVPLQDAFRSEVESEVEGALKRLGALLEEGAASAGAARQEGLVRNLFQLSVRTGQPTVQFQALQALRCLANADACAIVELGAVEELAPLLASGSSRTREQVLSVFTCLAMTSEPLRDRIVEEGALKIALSDISVQDANQPSPVTQKFAEFLCGLCSWEAPPALLDMAVTLVNDLAILTTANDEAVLLHALTALAALDFRSEDRLCAALKHSLFERLIFLFEQPSVDVCVRAAKAARKVAFSSMLGIQSFLLKEPIPALSELLAREEADAHREACEILADILSVGGPHVQEVVDAGCLARFAELLCDGPEEVRQAAVRAFTALSMHCSGRRLQDLIPEAVVLSTIALLVPDYAPQTVRPALRLLEHLVKAGLYLETVAGGVQKFQVIADEYGDPTACGRAKTILEVL